jgi:hypothetical protein
VNANVLARHYARLTPAERFRLILAANARGDETEQNRLCHSGRLLTLQVPDYLPLVQAFDELAEIVFLELLEEAARHHDAFDRWCDTDSARMFDLYLACGFILKAKLAGWQLFCERLGIPAFVAWQRFPGFQRLQHALQLLGENVPGLVSAFRPEGMLRWLSRIRPKGAPEPSLENLISPERFADELDKVFRQRVAWWGG